MTATLPQETGVGHGGTAGRDGTGRESRSELVLRRSPAGRTHIADRYVEYPLHLTRPFYLDGGAGDLATLYLQSSSGGLFQGDRHRLDVRVDRGARAHVTTQGATKVHSMRQGHAEQDVHLDLAEDALGEWIADPLILFPDSAASTTLSICMPSSAMAFAAEGFLYHDPSGGADPRFRSLQTEFSVRDEKGTLLVLDRQRIDGDVIEALAGPGAGGGFRTQGSVFVLADPAGIATFLAAARSLLAEQDGVAAGAGVLPNAAGAWARILATDAVRLQRTTLGLWRIFRHTVAGLDATARPK